MSRLTIAAYLRLSSEDADLKQGLKTESNSISNQRNLIQDFIHRTVELSQADIIEFCDDGWSGTNFERPAVQEMLTQARQGKIQCIVVKDLSRFGRDYLTVGNYISRIFPFLGVRFIAINDGLDSIRPSDVDSLDTSFKTILYDLYSRDLSRKVRSAKLFRAQRGDFLSPFAPFGYQKDPTNKNHLIVDAPAAENVRRIFHMAASGLSTFQIAKTLNEEAVPTPMIHKRITGCSRSTWISIHENNFWSHHTVTRILRDERYVGKAIYGKQTRTQVGDPHTILQNRADWIVVSDVHEGIVSQKEFDDAQRALRKFAEHKCGKKSGNILQSKIRCGVCGYAMTRSDAKDAKYCCSTPRVMPAYACPSEPVSESDILHTLLVGLRAQAEIAVTMEHIGQEQQQRATAGNVAMIQTLTALNERYKQQEQEIKSLYEAFALGEIDKSSYLSQKAVMVKKQDNLAAQIADLQVSLDKNYENGILSNRFVNCFKQYTDVLELTPEIVADVLDTLLIYPDGKLEIVWNYQDERAKLLSNQQEES